MREIDVAEEFIAVLVKPNLLYVLPKRCFASPDDMTAIVDAARPVEVA